MDSEFVILNCDWSGSQCQLWPETTSLNHIFYESRLHHISFDLGHGNVQK